MIEVVHTPCKKCVFAVYDNKTQTECYLKYLDKFRANNIDILEAYDEDLEFYVINNKKCLGYRENSWFKQFDAEEASIEEKSQILSDNNNINYLLFLYLPLMDLTDLDHIKNELNNTTLKPKRIVISLFENQKKTFTFDVVQKFLSDTGLKDTTKWQIQTIQDMDQTFEKVLHNLVSLNKKYRFMCYIRYEDNQNYRIEDVIKTANSIVYDEFGKFDIISNATKTCAIFSLPSYRFSVLSMTNTILEEETCYRYIP